MTINKRTVSYRPSRPEFATCCICGRYGKVTNEWTETTLHRRGGGVAYVCPDWQAHIHNRGTSNDRRSGKQAAHGETYRVVFSVRYASSKARCEFGEAYWLARNSERGIEFISPTYTSLNAPSKIARQTIEKLAEASELDAWLMRQAVTIGGRTEAEELKLYNLHDWRLGHDTEFERATRPLWSRGVEVETFYDGLTVEGFHFENGTQFGEALKFSRDVKRKLTTWLFGKDGQPRLEKTAEKLEELCKAYGMA